MLSESDPGPAVGVRDRAALLLGRLAGFASRRLRRGGGTALPGLLATSVAPDLIEALPDQLGHGVVAVTGTNGKTTTTHLLAAIVRGAGLRPLTNRSGANLERGLVSAYLAEADLRGRLAEASRRVGIFEIDEAALPALWPRLRPRAVVILNLFRDQLDRYGEVHSVGEAWSEMLRGSDSETIAVLNADDPSVAVLAEDTSGAVITFGVEDPEVALAAAEHAADARLCRCGEPFEYEAVYMGHVGRWRCRSGDRRRRPPTVAAERVELGAASSTFELVVGGERHAVTLPQAGLYSVYNALAAAAAAVALGLPLTVVVTALQDAAPAFGRQERLWVRNREVRIFLAKNPTGLNEVLRALTPQHAPAASELHLLMLLNDDIQDGRDVSWIYDADLEVLAGRVGSLICSGARADDLALRLTLAGVDPDAVVPDSRSAIDEALALTPAGSRLEVVATYTAMLDVRESLARAAGAAPYWESAPTEGAPTEGAPTVGRSR